MQYQNNYDLNDPDSSYWFQPRTKDSPKRINFVQSNVSTRPSGSTTINLTLPSNITQGNTLLVPISTYGSNSSATLSDNLGNVYRQIGVYSTSAGGPRVSLWKSFIANAGNCTITANFTVANYLTLGACEYSGINRDAGYYNTTNTVSSAFVLSGNVTIPSPDCLVFFSIAQGSGNSNITPSNGTSKRINQFVGGANVALYCMEGNPVQSNISYNMAMSSSVIYATVTGVFSPDPPDSPPTFQPCQRIEPLPSFDAVWEQTRARRWSTPTPTAIQVIRTISQTTSNSTASVFNTTGMMAGSTLLAWVDTFDSLTLSITDSLNYVWTRDAVVGNAATNFNSLQVFRSPKVPGGSMNITVSKTGAGSFTARIIEVQGLDDSPYAGSINQSFSSNTSTPYTGVLSSSLSPSILFASITPRGGGALLVSVNPAGYLPAIGLQNIMYVSTYYSDGTVSNNASWSVANNLTYNTLQIAYNGQQPPLPPPTYQPDQTIITLPVYDDVWWEQFRHWPEPVEGPPPIPPDDPASRQSDQRIEPLLDYNLREWEQFYRWPLPVEYIPTPPPSRQASQRVDPLPDFNDREWRQVRRWPILRLPPPPTRQASQRVDPLPVFDSWWEQFRHVPVPIGSFYLSSGHAGASGIYSSIVGAGHSGNSRVRNDIAGYNTWVGVGTLPNLDATPTSFNQTLPAVIPITPPVSGNQTYYVVTTKQDHYGLNSQNQYPEVFVINSSGVEVLPILPAPVVSNLIQQPEGYIRVLSLYSGYGVDEHPADVWKIWISTTPPNPAVDSPTSTYAVSSKTFLKDIGPYSPGLYYVVVALYRNADGFTSATANGTITVTPDPDEVVAVPGGFDI